MWVRIDLIMEVVGDFDRRLPLEAMNKARERLARNVHGSVGDILKDGFGSDSKTKIVTMATRIMKDK